MDSDSSSADSTASSCPSQGFICTVCFKVFRSGQALGGHQNAHLFERQFKQATPNILGAVLNHPLPHDDIHTLASALAAGSQSVNVRPPQNGGGNHRGVIIDVEEETSNHHHVEARGTHFYHPYERRQSTSEEESRRRFLTKNLMGEWESLSELKERQAMERSADQGIFDDDDDDYDDDTIDLELSLKRTETLDLELKLGF